MATEIIHEHEASNTSNNNSSLGLIIGIILLVVVVLFFLYIIRSGFLNGIGTNLPSVQVPSKIDVNINKGGKY